MSELEVRQQSAVEAASNEPTLVVWAQEAAAAYNVARSLVKTPFVPQSLSTPEAAAAAILAGSEVGLKPMAALRSVDIIQGTPAMRAVAQRALVQGAGHAVWEEDQTEKRAVVCGQRRGEDKIHRSVWTIERAQKLGLTSKDNWRKQPGAMLLARATAEACRLTAADVLLGLPYAIEELQDDITDDAPAPKRTARRKPVEPPPPSAEPDLPPPPADDVAEAEPIDPADYADMLPDEEK